MGSGSLEGRDRKGPQRGSMVGGIEGGGCREALKENDGKGIFWAGVSQFLSFGATKPEEDCFVLHTGFLHRSLFEIFLLFKVIKTFMRLVFKHNILNTGIYLLFSEILLK